MTLFARWRRLEGNFTADVRIRLDAATMDDAIDLLDRAMDRAQDIPGVHYSTSVVMEDPDA